MQSILVTGGAGFIGSHTCLSLLEKGYFLYVIDSFVTSSEISLQRVLKITKDKKNNLKIIKGSIANKTLLREIFSNSIKTINR